MEKLFFTGEIFVIVSFDKKSRLDPAIEDVTKEVIGKWRKKAPYPSQTGESLNVAGAEFAEIGRIEMITAIVFLQREVSKPYVEVALDRAQIDAEFIGQSQRFKLLPPDSI